MDHLTLPKVWAHGIHLGNVSHWFSNSWFPLAKRLPQAAQGELCSQGWCQELPEESIDLKGEFWRGHGVGSKGELEPHMETQNRLSAGSGTHLALYLSVEHWLTSHPGSLGQILWKQPELFYRKSYLRKQCTLNNYTLNKYTPCQWT